MRGALSSVEGRMPPFVLIVCIVGAVLAAVPIMVDVSHLSGMMVSEATVYGRDFANLWTGARAVLEDHTGLLYDLGAYQALQRDILSPEIAGHNFSYPPHVLLLIWPFGLLPYGAALGLWTVISLAAFFAAARPYLAGAGMPGMLSLVVPAALVNVWTGHYGLLIAAGALFVWDNADRMPIRCAIVLALLTVKPHLGILMPLVLLLRGKWKVCLIAGAVTLALAGVSAAVFGTQAWIEYLTRVPEYQAALLEHGAGLYRLMMPSVYNGFVLAGLEQAAMPFQVCAAALAVAAVFLVHRSGAPLTTLGLVAATATFLVLPYAFNYDMGAVCLAALLGMYRSCADGRPFDRLVYACAYLSPALIFKLNGTLPLLVPLFLLAMLFVEVRRAGGFSLGARAGAGAARSA